jgi:hypothetical protein
MDPIVLHSLIIYWCIGLVLSVLHLKEYHDSGYDITILDLVLETMTSLFWPITYIILYKDKVLLKGKPNGTTSKP